MFGFLKHYSLFIKTRASEADLWNIKQAPFKPTRSFITRFRDIKAQISDLNKEVSLTAFKNEVWFSSRLQDEM
ncbi:hypothetical protein Bca101_062076 [Brassica carinata]